MSTVTPRKPATLAPPDSTWVLGLVGVAASALTVEGQFTLIDSLIEATQGDLLLLRFINLSSTSPYTMQVMGMKWRVVGHDSRILRGGGVATGSDLYYESTSLTIAGGMTVYILIAIRVEERDLIVFHGQDYEDYRREVPMLFPTGKRYEPRREVQPG